MNIYRFLKAAFLFARHQAWVDEPKWFSEDAERLTNFLATPTGAKLRASLVNLAIRQQAQALSSTSGLKYAAGYATGQKAAIAHVEAMADPKRFTTEEEQGADPTSNQ